METKVSHMVANSQAAEMAALEREAKDCIGESE